MKTVEFDIGNIVLCDLCDKDYTNSDAIGGFVFRSKGVCPECAPRFRASIDKYGEERYIRGFAQEFETFRDFILRMRDGNSKVKITGPAEWADETAQAWKDFLGVKE